jgi:hypothetical protein
MFYEKISILKFVEKWLLTTTREVTLIKKHIILKSNRECANGNQTDINPKYV